MAYLENNPTKEEKMGETAKIKIVRIAPFLGGVEVEYRKNDPKGVYVKLVIKELATGETVFEEIGYCTPAALKADRLTVDVDYVAEVVLLDRDKEEIERSNARLFRCGFFPGKVIDYIHPDDQTFIRSGEFIGSPHIVRLDDGSYLAAHDVFSHDGVIGHEALCRIFASKDRGEHWKFASEIEHCTAGTLFTVKNCVYMLGNSGYVDGGGDIVLYCSKDGRTWSEPVVIAKRSKTACFRPCPMTYGVHEGRLWFYTGVYENNDNAVGVISADLNSDLTNPKSWVLSDWVHYEPEWCNGVEKWFPIMLEEGNVLVSPEGEMKILIRCNSHRYDTPVVNPENIREIVFKIDTKNPKAAPVFEKSFCFNGGLHKAYMMHDEGAERYVGMVNRITADEIWQRNVLSLVSSKDLETWQIERDLLNFEDIGWEENSWQCAVQYPSFVIEGNDAMAVVRTAINGADNFHNANAMTFHCFKNINDKYRF